MCECRLLFECDCVFGSGNCGEILSIESRCACAFRCHSLVNPFVTGVFCYFRLVQWIDSYREVRHIFSAFCRPAYTLNMFFHAVLTSHYASLFFCLLGVTIEEMLGWRGNHDQLEKNHGYIQWYSSFSATFIVLLCSSSFFFCVYICTYYTQVLYH